MCICRVTSSGTSSRSGVITGIAAWRVVPSSQRYEGAIGGLLAMALACFVAGVLIFGLAPVCAMATGNPLAVAQN